jgi:hypothetical protein
MEPEHRARSVGHDLLVVSIDEERERGPVGPGGGLDHVRYVPLVVPDPLELRAGVLGVLGKVEVAAIRDPLELRPADREEILEVARAARVVGKLLLRVRAHPKMALSQAEVEVPTAPLVDPVAIPLLCVGRRDEELHLHLLELARPEEEVPRRDLVPEALADLRDPERRLHPHGRRDVLEVHEDALGRFGPKESPSRVVAHRADERLEHQVEVARLRQVAVLGLAGMLRGLAAAGALVEVVGAEAELARPAVDERVGEAADMPRRDPDLGMEDDRRVQQDDVLAPLDHRVLPRGLDVLLQEHAVVAVVVRRSEAAVDVRGGEDERAATAEGGNLLDRRHALVTLQLLRAHGVETSVIGVSARARAGR